MGPAVRVHHPQHVARVPGCTSTSGCWWLGRAGRAVDLLGGEAGLAAWSAAAEAQRNLAKVAARRWGGAGVRVNVVSVPPALLGDDSDTEMGPRQRPDIPAPGEPAATVSAVADLVCMLVGPESRSLTGSTLVADGGSLMVP
ncbi:MAG: SDR family oxidoreductase [Microthrixaceae bacterium]